jgi:5,5'-dehydrodivanillate O-demethylase oxygenase subunit
MQTADNELLTRVGPGAPMGEVLRRYWHPIAAVTEFDARATKPIRLLGEDLVLYRDRSGAYGLLERHCPHRRADLSFGFVEDRGLRCSYHGWQFDEHGACLSQPFEDGMHDNRRFRESIKVRAYPVYELAGLLFAYLGPSPAPVCPNWELFTYENGFRQIVFADVPCNWLQCAENDIDPVHFEWLHFNWSLELSGHTGERGPKHREIFVDEWEFGYGYRRTWQGSDQSAADMATPRLHLMPNVFSPGGTHFEYRVPVDDENTLSVVWTYEPVPLEQRPYVQKRIPHWHARTREDHTGEWIKTHVINQDTAAWVGQGVIADRENEHLATSDLGVRIFRKQLQADLRAVAEGRDPKGVLRDPNRTVVEFPGQYRDVLTRGIPRDDWIAQRANSSLTTLEPDDYFELYAGQPEEVRKAFRAAMGI